MLLKFTIIDYIVKVIEYVIQAKGRIDLFCG